MQLGEVPIERTQVAALDVNVRFAAKHDRAKAVPLRLVEERAGRQIVGELREHRLDRRLDRKAHGCGGGRCSRKYRAMRRYTCGVVPAPSAIACVRLG